MSRYITGFTVIEVTNCFKRPYFSINPPIVEEPYRCEKGAKKMPSFWEREFRVADDCPLKESEEQMSRYIDADVLIEELNSRCGADLHIKY